MGSNEAMGGVTWFLARTGAVRRAATGALLALLLGLAAATVLVAWAGARRTDTAFERLRASTNHADLTVAAAGEPSLFDPTIALEGPGVEQAGIARGYPMVELRPDGTPDLAGDTALIAPDGPVAFQKVSRPVLAAGRAPDPSNPDEIVVPDDAVEEHPLGSRLDACFVDYEEALAYGHGVLEGTASKDQQLAFVDEVCEVRHLEVVGVTRPGPDEVVLREETEAETFPVGTPAFVEAVAAPPLFAFVLVELRPGADPEAYLDSVLDRVPPEAGVSTQSTPLRSAVVARTLEPHVRALALFAVLGALAAAAVLAPGIIRWAGAVPADLGPLRSLGIRPHQLRTAAALRGAGLGVVAAAIGTFVAWLASDRFPIGIAAEIEPFPGRRVDALVFVLGVGALVALTAAAGAVAPAIQRTAARRPSRVAEALQGVGVGPGPLAGVRAAVGGDGGGGLVRTVGGVAIAVAAIVAALTYQVSLARLLDTPARYGWTWDRLLDTADEPPPSELLAALAQDPDIDGVSLGYRMLLQRSGLEVQTFAFERITGDVGPGILDGRAPAGDDEIALGAQTLERIGAAVGDRVTFRGPAGTRADLTIVGRTLVPLTALGSELSVGEGGIVPLEVIERFGGADPGLVLVDLAPGASAGTVDEIVEAHAPQGIGGSGTQGPSHSADLRGYDAVRDTPLLLAGLLALLGIGVLAHTVVTLVGRRRHELAMLRCLGFDGRALRASVRWNVLTVMVACLVVAVPVGVAAGRLLWSRFANGLGVESSPITPLTAVAAVVLSAMVAALLFAVLPARQATRIRPAEVLRAE